MSTRAETRILRVGKGKAEISRKNVRKEAHKRTRSIVAYIATLVSFLAISIFSTGAKDNEASRHARADSRKIESGSNPCGADIECTLAWLKWKEQETTDKFDVKDRMPVEGTWPNDGIRNTTKER